MHDGGVEGVRGALGVVFRGLGIDVQASGGRSVQLLELPTTATRDLRWQPESPRSPKAHELIEKESQLSKIYGAAATAADPYSWNQVLA